MIKYVDKDKAVKIIRESYKLLHKKEKEGISKSNTVAAMAKVIEEELKDGD